MDNIYTEIELGRNDEHARLWKGPYGWQIYPAGEMNQIRVTKQYGHYLDHDKVLDMANMIKARGKNKPVFIDCGANIGNVTMAIRNFLGENVEIHAFEAQKTIAQMLTGSVALMSWDNVTVHNIAVTDGIIRKIEVPKYNYNFDGQYGSVELGREEPFRNADMTKSIAQKLSAYDIVEGRSIDSYKFPNVDLLKIDVEGMEIKALMGAEDTIQRCKPVMVIEHYKTNLEELRGFISKAGYRIVKEQVLDYICVPESSRT